MNSKICPHCKCNTVIKYGIQSSKQKYRCKNCHKIWTNQSRPSKIMKKIWHDFVWDNMPVRVLAIKYHKHPNTIRNIIHGYKPPDLNIKDLKPSIKAKIKVVIVDTTYFGRTLGIVTIVDAYTGRLLYFKEIHHSETNDDYYVAIHTIIKAGIEPLACVLDGRKGLANLLEEENILVQMCHFHMWQIVRRYLTNKPVLGPNIELKWLMDNFLNKHTNTDKNTFLTQIINWKHRNLVWLNERHRNEYGRLEWTHANTRKAYNAIISHSKWLFTYEDYPDLNIPKTSNMIEGKFGNAKDKLKLHHGYTNKLKIKIFFSLLSGDTGENNN